ncbi:hypothetical protein SSAG_00016 [Streptomyces sp. Mg1]|nr:hypothetical protein M444_34495 [Streptomyces sp. Mg1]EDX20224.1 hypothetical protein SSAG_00016 [Streptomyces sp. Mg1]
MAQYKPWSFSGPRTAQCILPSRMARPAPAPGAVFRLPGSWEAVLHLVPSKVMYQRVLSWAAYWSGYLHA